MTRQPEDSPEREDGSASGDFRAQVHARRADFERQFEGAKEATRAQFEATKAQFDHAQERIQQRTGRNLLLAIAIGLVLGLALLFSLIVVKEAFMVLAVLVVGFTAYELAMALRKAGYDVPRVVSVVAAVAVVPAAYYWGAGGQLLFTLGGIVVVAGWRAVEQAVPVRPAGRRGFVPDVLAGAFIQAYVTFLATFAVTLTAEDGGQWWTLAFVILVVVSDTGAYVSGLLFGKHPMAPVISPKKTWEGFAGSVVVCLLAGVLLAIFMLGQSWWFGLGFGAAMCLAGTLGDLGESLIKRDLGIKDMSSWLPGHGGFLDRLDSILPAAAIAYAAYVIVT
jgi:phosphatidate cytidylyltransferase